MMRVFAAAFLAAFAFSRAADAQFMKPGPSPEAGFSGIWRVIGARTAPWALPRKLTRADATLLEYAVEFRDGQVNGPKPLACANAKFSSGVSYADDLFGGKLKQDRNGAMAKALNLTNAGITTFRVICGADVRDYYVDDNAAIAMAVGNVIYTLQRPDSMDGNQMTAGYTGPSFDCTKANTAAEKAICTDAALAKADRKMDAAYRRLKATETPESFATVQASQRSWLSYVLKSCSAGDGDGAGDLNQCLQDNYPDRADRLDGVRALKAGALVLEPRMRFFSKSKPETEESDIYPWMAGGRETAAFNAFVFKALGLDKRRMDDKNLFPFGNDVNDLKLFARRTYSVARFDSRIVSLEIWTYDYTGGAHEVLGEFALNWDMAKARPILLTDVFDGRKPWKRFVTDFCMKDLHDQFAAQEAPDPDRAAVENVVSDGANWLWGKDKATVHFTVYTVASFSGGEFDVDIPYAGLKPFLRAGAPVP